MVVQQPVVVSQAPVAASTVVVGQANAANGELHALREKVKQLEAVVQANNGQQNTVAAAPAANVARITVNLPAEAKLFVDNVSCPLTSNVRSFNTPALQAGQKYYYTLKVEVERDGVTASQQQRVYVAAGQQVNVDFNSMTTASREE